MQGLRIVFFTIKSKYILSNFYKILIIIFSSSLLSCGGGSGGELPSTVAPDTKPPVIKTIKPTPGSKTIDINSFIEIEFDENIKEFDTNNVLIRLYENINDTEPTGPITLKSSDLSLNQNTLSVKPGLLIEAKKYQVIIKSFKDLAGNTMKGQCQWDFATSKYTGNVNNHAIGNCGLSSGPPLTIPSISGGTYNSAQTVSLTCTDAAGLNCANIFYTLDGSKPSTNSSKYSNPINISNMNATTILKYFGVDSVGTAEVVKTQTYIIDTQAPTKPVALTATGTNGGLEGGSIDTLAIDPTDSTKVYAGILSGGLFKSNIINNLPNWTMNGLKGKSIVKISIHPTNSLILFVSTTSGLYKTTNAGTSWQLIQPGSSRQHILDPNNSDIIYNAGDTGIQKSIDGGKSFATSGALAGKSVISISIDFTSTSMYAATFTGLFKSIDNGISWNQILSSNFTNSNQVFYDVDIDPKNVNTIYATSDHIYKSVNAGVTWSVINSSSPLHISIHPTNSNILYNMYVSNFSKSTDGGATWTTVLSTTSFLLGTNIIFDSKNASIMYAGFSGEGIYRSIDSGTTWLPWNGGLSATTIQSLTQDSVSSSTLYAGTSSTYGLVKSTNGGASWVEYGNYNKAFSNLSYFIDDITLDPNNSKNIFVSHFTSGIHHSIDDGVTWTTIEFETPSIGTISRKVVFDNINPAIVYAIGYIAPNNTLYKSMNNGSSWSKSSIGLPTSLIDSTLKVDPVNTNILYVAGNISTGFDIFKSKNAGVSWTALNTGFKNIVSLEINPTNSIELYLGNLYGEIYKTIDGGTTWTKVATVASNADFPYGEVNIIQVSPLNSNIVYAGTGGKGLFRSSNAGKDWSLINVNNMNSNYIYSLHIDYNDDNIIYAGSRGGGVWKIIVTP